jgi:hypothetical protein
LKLDIFPRSKAEVCTRVDKSLTTVLNFKINIIRMVVITSIMRRRELNTIIVFNPGVI